jgi:Protein of unknown function (DUF1056)
VGTHLGARRRDVHGEDGHVIRRRVLAFAWFVWKLAAAVLVILLVLFLVGWFVDAVVEPAEQEISAVSGVRAEHA